jgi:hypothetical protein
MLYSLESVKLKDEEKRFLEAIKENKQMAMLLSMRL